MKVRFFVFGSAIVLFALIGCSKPAKNIIFMCPDGMGLSNAAIARTYIHGPDGKRLSFETLPYIGYQRTASKNSFVTDSAAAASAWASGEKFNNGEISCHDDDGDGLCDDTRKNKKTILELAGEKNMGTGLVVTSDITHATPAAWGAHVHHRKCESEIFKQLLAQNIDVMLGGGIEINREPCKLEATGAETTSELIAKARSKGYTYVKTKNELLQLKEPDKLLGLFQDEGLTPVYQRLSDSAEPDLEMMTQTALSVLEKNPKGFFLMVEGSQVDWANHDRNLEYLIGEMTDFDNAAKTVLDWIAQKPERGENTLLIIVADHECGGVIIEGPNDSLPRKGQSDTIDVVFSSNYRPPKDSASHTAVDTIIWSNHPACGRAMENTDLFYIMKQFMEN